MLPAWAPMRWPSRSGPRPGALSCVSSRSPLIGILFAAAVLALVLGHYGDAAVILVVVVVNAVIGTFQEGRAERSMAALRELAELQVRVLRDGAERTLPARDLVPGDVVLLAAGDAVAADARLLDAAQFQVAEAALTGESVPVAKSTAALPEATALSDRHCMVYSGTHVTAGRARALVVATGAATEVGRIAGPHRRRRRAAHAARAARAPLRPLAGRRRAGAVRRGGRARCAARAAAGRSADGGDQPDGVDGARGAAGGDDDRARCRHAAHGCSAARSSAGCRL